MKLPWQRHASIRPIFPRYMFLIKIRNPSDVNPASAMLKTLHGIAIAPKIKPPAVFHLQPLFPKIPYIISAHLKSAALVMMMHPCPNRQIFPVQFHKVRAFKTPYTATFFHQQRMQILPMLHIFRFIQKDSPLPLYGTGKHHIPMPSDF